MQTLQDIVSFLDFLARCIWLKSFSLIDVDAMRKFYDFTIE